MTIKALYPTVRPTLNLDFAKTKVLDPRVTFTRASTATFVGANGLVQSAASGIARFDHTPATGESLGLLVEEARTNIALYSEQINSSNWSVLTGALSLDSSLSPSGTQPYLFTSSSSSGGGYVYRSVGTVSGNHTFSVFVKKNGAQKYAWIDLYAGADYAAVFDLDTGAYAGNSGLNSYDSYSITAVGNGWFRITGTKNLPAGSYTAGLSVTRTPTSGLTNSSGDSIFIWGAQVEAGAFPTSYIPTTTATVTRAADVASMTASPYLYGTFLARYKQHPPSGLNRHIFSVGNADAYSAFVCRTATNSTVNIVLPGISDLTGTANTETSGFNNVATTRVLGDYAVCLNGGTVAKSSITSDQSNNSVITFMYGTMGATSGGTIARFAYYPVRVTDTQLQAITAS